MGCPSVVLLFVVFCISVCISQPIPLNGYRAAFVVGANEDLSSPAIQFGISAVSAVTGWSYSDIINNLYNPGKAWWLYRFGVDFTNAVELYFPGSGFFYNGYALASPIVADGTYRVIASNVPVFNGIVPSNLFLTEYAVTFNNTALQIIESQLGHPLYYNGTYGNPNNQAPSPRIPINAGAPFRSDNIYYGVYTATVWASQTIGDEIINAACDVYHTPMKKIDMYKHLIKDSEISCPYPSCPSPSQVNFTFWMRAYDPSVGYPYYAVPSRSMERQQLCSPQFGPGMSILNVATAVQNAPINGSYPTFLEAGWVFPMNGSNSPVPDFFGWNDCGCCQGCVPRTPFPPLTNPPGSSSSSSTGSSELMYNRHGDNGGHNRLDSFKDRFLKKHRN